MSLRAEQRWRLWESSQVLCWFLHISEWPLTVWERDQSVHWAAHLLQLLLFCLSFFLLFIKRCPFVLPVMSSFNLSQGICHYGSDRTWSASQWTHWSQTLNSQNSNWSNRGLSKRLQILSSDDRKKLFCVWKLLWQAKQALFAHVYFLLQLQMWHHVIKINLCYTASLLCQMFGEQRNIRHQWTIVTKCK